MNDLFDAWVNEHADGFAIFPTLEDALFSAEESLQGRYTCKHVEEIGRYVRTFFVEERALSFKIRAKDDE